MSTLMIEDFKIGLDRRRMNETSLPGSLVLCQNAHITRGGEVEKSEAFVRFCDLPANTFGLKAVGAGFMVWGSDDITPRILSSNPLVRYQRLNDTGGTQSWGSFTISGQVVADTFTSIKVGGPSGTQLLAGTTTCSATPANWPGEIAAAINAHSGTSGYSAYAIGNTITVYANAVGTADNGKVWDFSKTGTVIVASNVAFSSGVAATNPDMIAILSVDLFDGLPYVIADYEDGVVRHWYDGTKVAAMTSGKARAKFTIEADVDEAAAVRATGSFVIVEAEFTSSITSIMVDTQELLAEALVYVEPDPEEPSPHDDDSFPTKVVDAINANSNQSGFTAELQAGTKVVITAQIAGSAVNGDAVSVSTTGDITIQNEIAMNGGEDAEQITAVTINGSNILPVAVDWAESDQQTASAVAAAINDNTDVSTYQAVAYGATVLIRKTTDGTAANGHTFVVTADPAITITNAPATVGGGSAVLTVIEPGRFNKTFKNKMYVLSGPSIYYSRIGVPDEFEGTGSGFDNLSTNASGAEQLIAIANYFDDMAIFSRNNVQIWFMSDDPDENAQLQVLNNTGTVAPGSVVEFGDNDVFYLSESGVRSLRARDTTNAAFVNDVGIAIDPLIQEEILRNNQAAENAQGILEPRQGRYMLAIGGRIYVFSFFPSSKISAWSTYVPGFVIKAWDSIGQTIVCRSENALYKIGSSVQRAYDSREVKFITPFLPGDDPSATKNWAGLDLACEGTWEIYVASDPLRVDEDGMPQEEYFTKVATVTGTTYSEEAAENGHVPMSEVSTHIALMLINKSPGYARVGNICVHIAKGRSKEQNG